jgi:LPXTG-site transpeptidase (sortase) family protein
MLRRPRPQKRIGLVLIAMIWGVIFGVLYILSDVPPPEPENQVVSAISTSLAQSLLTQMPGITPTALQTREPPALLTVPEAGIQAPIIRIFLGEHSWNVTGLGRNAGHLNGTGWIDQPGNIVLAGHVEMADGEPGIFASLDNLTTGDWVTLRLPSQEERFYKVSDVLTIDPQDLSVLFPTDTERLTLVTCGAYNFMTNKYNERIVVIADRFQ